MTGMQEVETAVRKDDAATDAAQLLAFIKQLRSVEYLSHQLERGAVGSLHEERLAQFFELDGAVTEGVAFQVDFNDRGLGKLPGDERFR